LDLKDGQERRTKTMMKSIAASVAAVILLAAGASPLFGKQQGLTGTWTLSAEGYVLKMILVQTGKKLTGTLESTHGPMPMRGQFAKGRMTFTATGPDGIGGRLELSATGVLQADGTLAGDLTSTTTGHLRWTAVRSANR
jgi:hypothetical protein